MRVSSRRQGVVGGRRREFSCRHRGRHRGTTTCKDAYRRLRQSTTATRTHLDDKPELCALLTWRASRQYAFSVLMWQTSCLEYSIGCVPCAMLVLAPGLWLVPPAILRALGRELLASPVKSDLSARHDSLLQRIARCRLRSDSIQCEQALHRYLDAR